MTSLLAAFSWEVIWENREPLAEGLRRTLEVSALGIVGAFGIGLVLGAARAHRIPLLNQFAGVYVELIRNTPILVQIFLLYYGWPNVIQRFDLLPDWLPPRLDGYTTAWLAVMIWGGAFNTENFRAGFEAVPYRYREAGLALGFSRIATFFRVTLPIGGRIALPSSINTYISVLKNTSLMTAIGFMELTTTARSISASNFRDVEMLTVVAVTYLVIVWGLSLVIRAIERHLALPEEAR
jgi:His/Glu/Gln/Arg/opine family amino acid ABC transporter permease subunit